MLDCNATNQKSLANFEWRQRVLDQCLSDPHTASIWRDVKRQGDDGEDSRVLPIHLACAARPPQRTLEAIVRAYPAGVSTTAKPTGRLPLHIACLSGASPELISFLLLAYPDAARTRDCLGRLPLHCACSSGASVIVIDALLELCPGAARAEDGRGELPVHAACGSGAPVLVVRRLADAFPESVLLRTGGGRTPESLAMEADGPDGAEVVAVLREAGRRAGRLPTLTLEGSRKMRRARKHRSGRKLIRAKKMKAGECSMLV